MVTRKAKQKLTKKQVVIGGTSDESKSGGRKVIVDPRERARINPPLSSWASEKIERLEAASSRTRQRLGLIRMN